MEIRTLEEHQYIIFLFNIAIFRYLCYIYSIKNIIGEEKMELFENTINTKEIYNGKIFKIKQDLVELPDGSTTTRDLLIHNGGVGVIAVNSEGKIPMVRQFRKGIEQISLEIPAGKLELGENPETCGIRELQEETGYIAKSFEYLTKFSPTPAYCSEIIYIYKAKDLEFIGQNLDENEYLNVEFYTMSELVEMVKSGEIIDAKTIIAIMMLKENI